MWGRKSALPRVKKRIFRHRHRLRLRLCTSFVVLLKLLFLSQRLLRSHAVPAVPTIVVFFGTRKTSQMVDVIFKTWGREVLTVAYGCTKDAIDHPRVTPLSEIPCGEYPPIRGWAAMLSHIFTVNVSWYLKVDDDTYIHPENLYKLLRRIADAGISGRQHFVYTGLFGTGRPYEVNELGLNGSSYVLGGPGVLMSRRIIEELRPLLPACMLQHIGNRRHSDTQLAFCVSIISNHTRFRKQYKQLDIGHDFIHHSVPPKGRGLWKSGAQVSFEWLLLRNTISERHPITPFSESTVRLSDFSDGRNEHAVTHHSVKDAQLMTDLHETLHPQKNNCDENPVYIAKKECNASCKCLPRSWHGTCDVNDEQIHQSVCMRSSDSQTLRSKDIAAYVLTIQPRVVGDLVKTLEKHFGPVHVIQGILAKDMESNVYLSSGEIAYRESMRVIMEHAIESGYETVAVFDDDVMFYHDYGKALEKLLRHGHCSCILTQRSGCRPGVLKLGNTAWGRDFNVRWAEYEHNHTGFPCTTFNRHDLGSYAVIYNTAVFHDILIWLTWQNKLPFDWVYAWLAESNFPVKAAFPFLNIADVSHPSSVKKRVSVKNVKQYVSERAIRHGWNIGLYAPP